MRIRNNSKHEWLGYDCGGCIVDILPESEIEVDEKAGMLLLRNLGHESWLVKVEEVKVEVEVVEEPKSIEVVEEKPFCEHCDSKGRRHKKECPTLANEE